MTVSSYMSGWLRNWRTAKRHARGAIAAGRVSEAFRWTDAALAIEAGFLERFGMTVCSVLNRITDTGFQTV